MPCTTNGSTSSLQSNIQIEDWARLNTYHAEGVYSPEKKQDIVKIIQTAERDSKKLKAVGSIFSLSKVNVTDHYLLRTEKLNKFLSRPYPGNGKLGSGRSYRSATHNRNWLHQIVKPGIRLRPNHHLVYFEAGMKIKDLLHNLDQRNLAIPTMGAGGAQSIIGAISTGTHGSDVRKPPPSDYIRAIHLIGPGGQEWWIEPSEGLTTTDQLSNLPDWCVDTKIIQEDAFFQAALVSMGRMGVIYAIIFEAPNQSILEQRADKLAWSTVKRQLQNSVRNGYYTGSGVFNDTRNGQPLRFYQLNMAPNSPDDCYIMKRWESTNSTTVFDEKYHKDPLACFCNYPGWKMKAVIDLFLATASPLLIPWAVDTFVKIKKITVESKTLGEMMSKLFRVGREFRVVGIKSDLLDKPLADIASGLLEGLHYHDIDARDSTLLRAKSHKILDTHNYDLDNGCFTVDSVEYFFDAQSEAYIHFVEDVFSIAKDYNPVGGIIALRYIRQSDSLLSMEQFPLTVAVEVAALRPSEVNDRYMQRMKDAALARGGIPHWGQAYLFSQREVEQRYGEKINLWRKVLSEIESYGKKGTFSSSFTRQKGLETKKTLVQYQHHFNSKQLSYRKYLEQAKTLTHHTSNFKSIRAVKLVQEPFNKPKRQLNLRNELIKLLP